MQHMTKPEIIMTKLFRPLEHVLHFQREFGRYQCSARSMLLSQGLSFHGVRVYSIFLHMKQ